ncbi:hypothetical protein ACS0TY_021120 [Phlomoides rotata]
MKTLTGSSNSQSLGGIINSEIITSHTTKWMQDSSKKSLMNLINEVPLIQIVACEGDNNLTLHPFEFICLHKEVLALCTTIIIRFG